MRLTAGRAGSRICRGHPLRYNSVSYREIIMASAWIDVHGHFVPPKHGLTRSPGTQEGSDWTFSPETNIAYMDRSGVAAQIVSNCNQTSDVGKIIDSNTYGASLVE